MTQRVLVTGARGFVGSYLCAALAARAQATDIVALVAGHEDAAGGIAADITDRAAMDAVVARVKPDVIVHLAAQASVAQSAADASDTWAVNLSGSLNLAVAAARHVPDVTLLFASSSEVYGASFLGGVATETTPTLPLNAYARSKRLAEDMFDAVLPASARLIVARPFNHTGPAQRDTFVLPSFASQVAGIEAGRQPAELRVGNIDVKREFMHVADVVAAYVALVDHAPRLPHRFLCNIASQRPRPLRELIDILRAMSRVPFEIVVDPARVRAVDIPSASGDASLLRMTTGWTPNVSIETVLEGLLEHHRRPRS